MHIAHTGSRFHSEAPDPSERPHRSSPRSPHQTTDVRDRAQIEEVLSKYEHALNSSDVNGAVGLYADNGVFMAPGNPPAVGTQAIQDAYTGVFRQIAPNLKFKIEDMQQLSPDSAVLRTTSSGTVKNVADGTESPSSNQELFTLRKEQGQWLISNYSFSSTLPPTQ